MVKIGEKKEKRGSNAVIFYVKINILKQKHLLIIKIV